MEKKRFQNCNVFGKAWRFRWYLLIPFEFIFHYLVGLKIGRDEIIEGEVIHTDKFDVAHPSLTWQLLKSQAQYRMKWYYTAKEVDEKLGHLFDKIEQRIDEIKQ